MIGRPFTIAMQYLVSSLILMTGLSVYGCSDSASVSNETQVPLASLTITPPGALQPAFSSNTTSYAAEVPKTVASVTVMASPQDSTATMTINAVSTAAGQGRSIPLGPPGSTVTITITVSSQTDSDSTYTVTITRLLSSDNNLSALTVTPGILAPTFTSGTLNYTVDVATTVTSVTVAATKSDPDAVMSGSVTAGTGAATGQATLPLDGPGTSKNVSITVTAPNGNAKTYTITVNRAAPSNDANLSALTVSAGTLNPGFAAGTPNYTVTVPASVDSMTVTATKSDPNAVMSSSGSVIAPAGVLTGSVSSALGLGATTLFTITVIAQDGVSTRPYTINVFRDAR